VVGVTTCGKIPIRYLERTPFLSPEMFGTSSRRKQHEFVMRRATGSLTSYGDHHSHPVEIQPYSSASLSYQHQSSFNPPEATDPLSYPATAMTEPEYDYEQLLYETLVCEKKHTRVSFWLSLSLSLSLSHHPFQLLAIKPQTHRYSGEPFLLPPPLMNLSLSLSLFVRKIVTRRCRTRSRSDETQSRGRDS
jgi:hypothetical protein